ncbi:MAG: PDZ domain-containing protein [Candidatus Scalindua sp.]|nr:PDZ domain-containing protein [Candidatus Scalindua sp.]
MKERLLFVIIIVILSIGTGASTLFAQSLFSGLILSERSNGLMVVGVQNESPVYNAGLRVGDVVLEVEGKNITKLEDYVEISRKIKKEKVEAYLTILREGIKYEAVIKVYSIPVYQSWKEKVAKPAGAPRDAKGKPYDYWFSKGKRSLIASESGATFNLKERHYNEAITYLYYGLHYQPDSIDTVLLIAEACHKLGNLYLNRNMKEDSIKKYKNSLRLYTGLFKKTQKEEHLKLILSNLQEIEKELARINPEAATSS